MNDLVEVWTEEEEMSIYSMFLFAKMDIPKILEAAASIKYLASQVQLIWFLFENLKLLAREIVCCKASL